MATLDSLKQALRQKDKTTASSLKQPLSDTQYSAGFDILVRGSGWITYQDFIIPQLSQLLATLLTSRNYISALEIGPGPKSLLGYLPGRLRRMVRKYTAFEPNDLFATRLEEWLCSTSETEPPLLCLENPPDIHRIPFGLQDNVGNSTSNDDEKYDIILFCHSMYGMKPKRRFIERALEMLVEQPQGGMVAVFHRDGALHLDGLVCHETASFPTGVVSVANDDEVLNGFASFVAGFTMQDVDLDKAIRDDWRKVCRALGHREEAHPDHLFFSSPNVMAAFTQHATTLPELTAQVPLVKGDKIVKNQEARLHQAYACPLPKAPMKQKLIILVTGESCAGKDYCADVWVSMFIRYTHKSLTARAVSIGDAIKREYAASTGADLSGLLWDRAYKEQHRPALTGFFQEQARQRPRLLEEHFLNVVYGAVDVDVLLITGMRDEAPVAALSHLVLDSRLLEVHVQASEQTRRIRRGCNDGDGDGDENKNSNNSGSNLAALDYRPSLMFDNDTTGNEAAKRFADHYLLPFIHEDLQRLANMVRQVADFPRPGIEFHHVLGISQQPGGLELCTSLLQTHFTGDWVKVDAVACCEVGGFVYASALASRVDLPLMLIREAGKLPPQPFLSSSPRRISRL